MPLIGTAGHVDHGKSTLLQALTGRDPDRLTEEKERGLTIDLGFAWADLGNGTEVSFVDVPGHERYLKNMLAGVEAIGTALLVIDANEGWMPQTEEHVAVLSLLGIQSAVVAITKVDSAPPDVVDLAVIEASEKLEGTSLQDSPIIPVSAVAGTGLDALRTELTKQVSKAPDQRGPTRLWVDRTFSIAGTGTVVTGSLLGQPVDIGDTVAGIPGGFSARIRSIQTHERPVERGEPGSRVALGLSGPSVKEISRGTLLVRDGSVRDTNRFVIRYETARYVDELPSRGAYQLHIGTTVRNVRFQQFESDVALVSTDLPIALMVGDRFIVRDTGRRLVIAGGVVLDPQSGSQRVALKKITTIDPQSEPSEIADQLLAIRGSDLVANLTMDSGGGLADRGVVISDTAYTPGLLEEVRQALTGRVESFHVAHPLRDGIPLATLADQLGHDASVIEEIADKSGDLSVLGPVVAAVGHRPDIPESLVADWERARNDLNQGLETPSVDQLGLPDELVHLLTRRGDLVQPGGGIVYLPDQITDITERIATLSEPFSVGDAKDVLGLSRKYVVPLLEWLDQNGLTVRKTDGRLHGPTSTRRQN